MSTVVDTSVWSEALRRKNVKSDSEIIVKLKTIIDEGNVILPGIIAQEILQGITDKHLFEKVKNHLDAFPMQMTSKEDHIKAAQLKNNCKKKGITIHTIDALIASFCLNNNYSLLTLDNDFLLIAKIYPLKFG